jgi:preprotein translocase SecE subunit
VARPTRAQRRARRQQPPRGDGSAERAPRPRQAQLARTQPTKTQGGGKTEAGRFRFPRESWAELKKVDWPGQSQVVQATVVVIIACGIVGAWLFAADSVFHRLINDWLIK